MANEASGPGGGKKPPTSTTTTTTKPINVTPGTGTKPTTTSTKPVKTTSGTGTKPLPTSTKPTTGSSGSGKPTQGSDSKPSSSTKKDPKANSGAKSPKESKAPSKPFLPEYGEDFEQKAKAKTTKADQEFDLLRLKYSDPMAKKLISAYQTRPEIIKSVFSQAPSDQVALKAIFAKSYYEININFKRILTVLSESNSYYINTIESLFNTLSYFFEPIPDTAAERSAVYSAWTSQLQIFFPPLSDIQFYDAAAAVTSLLGTTEENQLGYVAFNLMTLGWFAPEYTNAIDYLDVIGEDLFDLNRNIYSELISGQLIDDSGRLISAYSGQPVDSAIDWNINMVWQEQSTVEETLQTGLERGDITREDVGRISSLLNLDDPGLIQVDFIRWPIYVTYFMDQPVGWAEDALGHDVDFARVQDRRAIGIAYIFEEHDLTYFDYMKYMSLAENSSEPVSISTLSYLDNK